MNSKVITAAVVEGYGEGFEGTFIQAKTLAEEIKSLHTEISQKTDTMDTDKKELGAKSKSYFFKDLTKDEPEVVGNHEYHLDSGDKVTVNFKVEGKPFEQINGKPAYDVLQSFLKEHTDTLFGKQDAIQVTAPEFKLKGQACDHPELFEIGLKPLTHDQKMQLVKEHPDWVGVIVTDVPKYAEIYPADVDKKTFVSYKTGFVEALTKLDTIVRKSSKGLLKALLKDTLKPAVLCGNRSKK